MPRLKRVAVRSLPRCWSACPLNVQGDAGEWQDFIRIVLQSERESLYKPVRKLTLVRARREWALRVRAQVRRVWR
jgi:hypothetical protein